MMKNERPMELTVQVSGNNRARNLKREGGRWRARWGERKMQGAALSMWMVPLELCSAVTLWRSFRIVETQKVSVKIKELLALRYQRKTVVVGEQDARNWDCAKMPLGPRIWSWEWIFDGWQEITPLEKGKSMNWNIRQLERSMGKL